MVQQTNRPMLAAALLALGIGLAPSTGQAENRAAVEMARARFQEGVTYFDAGRFEEARAAFLQAYALRKHPAVLLNIAQSELRAGYHADAATHFVEYLETASDAEDSQRETADRGLSEAKSHVGEVHISSDVESAEVSVDGKNVGVTPLPHPLFLEPGRHTIRAQRGQHSSETTVEAKAAGEHSVELLLHPVQSHLRLTTPQSNALRAPPQDGSFDHGSAPSDGRQPFGEWLISSPVGLTGLVVTGAGLALGTAGTIVATNRYRSAQNATDDISAAADAEGRTGTVCVDGTSPVTHFQRACSERQRRLNQGDTWRGLAIGGFVGGAAAAAGTIAYYFFESPTAGPVDTAKARRPVVVPIATTEMQGLSVSGSF